MNLFLTAVNWLILVDINNHWQMCKCTNLWWSVLVCTGFEIRVLPLLGGQWWWRRRRWSLWKRLGLSCPRTLWSAAPASCWLPPGSAPAHMMTREDRWQMSVNYWGRLWSSLVLDRNFWLAHGAKFPLTIKILLLLLKIPLKALWVLQASVA